MSTGGQDLSNLALAIPEDLSEVFIEDAIEAVGFSDAEAVGVSGAEGASGADGMSGADGVSGAESLGRMIARTRRQEPAHGLTRKESLVEKRRRAEDLLEAIRLKESLGYEDFSF